MGNAAQPAQYVFRVRGVLSQTLLEAFPRLNAQAQAGETVLVGTLADQSAFYGVVAQLEALGLEVLEVRRIRSC